MKTECFVISDMNLPEVNDVLSHIEFVARRVEADIGPQQETVKQDFLHILIIVINRHVTFLVRAVIHRPVIVILCENHFKLHGRLRGKVKPGGNLGSRHSGGA